MAGCASRAGVYSRATSSAGVTSVRRSRVDWLPRADEQWIDPKTGRPTRRFYQFLREVAENRLGGVVGQTVPQVATAVSATSAVAATVGVFATQVRDYAVQVNESAEATRTVSVDNGLTGAGDIPPGPSAFPTYEP